MGSHHTYHATFKRTTYHRQLSHQHRCANTILKTLVPPYKCESIIYQAHTPNFQKTFKTSTKITNISLVIRVPFYKDRKLPYTWSMRPKGHCEVGEYIKRHLKVIDSTKGKRKLVNSNLTVLKINFKADMPHKLPIFHFITSESSNKK